MFTELGDENNGRDGKINNDMEITKKSEGMFANQNTTASQTLKLKQTPIGWKTVIINNADKVRKYTISKRRFDSSHAHKSNINDTEGLLTSNIY